MAVVPDRLWALMTDEEQAELRSFVAGMLRPTFQCPNCKSEVGVRVKLSFGVIALDTGYKTPPQSMRVERPKSDLQLLAQAKDNGMFGAYEKALREEKQDQVPRALDAIEDLFLKFFQLGVPLKACNGAKDAYRARYTGHLDFVQSNGVVGVTEDRALIEFAPLRYFRIPKGSVALASPREKAEEWIKTRFGYVPKTSTLFASAMRNKSVGGFGRLVQ